MKAVTILLLVVLAGFFVATRGNPTGDGGSTNQMTGSQHQAGSDASLNTLLIPVFSTVHGGLDASLNTLLIPLKVTKGVLQKIVAVLKFFFTLVKATEEEKQKIAYSVVALLHLLKATKGEQQKIAVVLNFIISLKKFTTIKIILIADTLVALFRLVGFGIQEASVNFFNLLIKLVNATKEEQKKIVAELQIILQNVKATKGEQQKIAANFNGLLSLLGIDNTGNGSMPGGSGGNNGYTKGQGSSGNNKGYPIEGNGSGNGLGGPGGKSNYPGQEAPNMPGGSSG